MNEEQLIKEIKHKPELFDQVYEEHFSTIFNYCFRRIGSFDQARDITSETFLKAYLNIHKFKWKGIPILSWLYRIAGNEIHKYFRSQKYKPEYLIDTYEDQDILYPVSEDLEQEKAIAEAEWEKHKQFVELQIQVKNLKRHYQEVISLRFFEGLKIKEIAQVLNKKEGTVKSLLSRALKQLRTKLDRNLFQKLDYE